MFTIALINNMKSVKLVRYWLHINIVTWIYIFYLARQKKNKKKVTEHVNVLGPERACCWYSACCKAFFGQVQGWLLRTWPSLKSRSRCIGFFFFFFLKCEGSLSPLYKRLASLPPLYTESSCAVMSVSHKMFFGPTGPNDCDVNVCQTRRRISLSSVNPPAASNLVSP